MNFFFLCTLIISLFSSINGMDNQPQKSSIWTMTCDNALIEIDQVIARQSNLLIFLQKEYPGTFEFPLLIPMDKNDFEFFISCLTKPASTLYINLKSTDYWKLIDITKKLNCPIFYSELIEQVIDTDIKNLIGGNLHLSNFNERTKKLCVKKKLLKKNKSAIHPNLINSKDGLYFTENISTKKKNLQINLWCSNPLERIAKFPEYTDVVFDPSGNLIGLYAKEKPFLLYSINKKTLKAIQTDFAQKYIDFKYYFLPNSELIWYADYDGYLVSRAIKNPSDQEILFKEKTHFPYATTSQNSCGNKTFISTCWLTKKASVFCIEKDTSNGKISLQKLVDITCDTAESKPVFNPRFNISAYVHGTSEMRLTDVMDNEIARHRLDNYNNAQNIFDKTGKYLISLYRKYKQFEQESTLIFWNLSNIGISDRISGIKVHITSFIKNIECISDDLLLSNGNRTIIWNMKGDQVQTLGKNLHTCISVNNCFIAGKYNEDRIYVNDNPENRSCIITNRRVKLYSIIDRTEKVKNKLSLSQYFLLDKPLNELTTLHPNMPDGRAFASLKPKYQFFAKNIKLAKHNFIPKTASTYE